MEHDRILLAHGGGARMTTELVRSVIAPRFANPVLNRFDDSAVLPTDGGRIAFTTDSYVVAPLFFPGGTIGDLAVCGTVNDLAMSGATPKYVSLSLILEEGLRLADLERVLDSVRRRAEEAAVAIVCGDTKVVPKGAADGMFINTAGIGVVPKDVEISSANARPGDRLIVSGILGLHGLAVMLSRGDFGLTTPLESDVAPLHGIVAALLQEGIRVRCLRDLTRGGLAMALHDISEASAVALEVEEAAIPTSEAQASACELLGLDPLQVPCEGRFLAVVLEAHARRAVEIIRRFDAGRDAAIVGAVKPRGRYGIELLTRIGGRRVLMAPSGEQMPRIC